MTVLGRDAHVYRILIVEDAPSEADVLRSYLQKYAGEKGLSFSIEVLGSALEFINSRRVADLVFMDIDMPGINGMEAAEILRTYDTETPLVFVTNLAQYAVRGYAVDAVDFVVKPVEYGDFAMRMDRAMRVVERNAASSLALPTADGVRVVPVSEVLYLDMVRHDVRYHLADGTSLLERGSLRAAEERLGAQTFLRISSGCLVNMARVERIGRESVTMADGAELFYSRSQRKRALETLANYVGRSF